MPTATKHSKKFISNRWITELLCWITLSLVMPPRDHGNIKINPWILPVPLPCDGKNDDQWSHIDIDLSRWEEQQHHNDSQFWRKTHSKLIWLRWCEMDRCWCIRIQSQLRKRAIGVNSFVCTCCYNLFFFIRFTIAISFVSISILNKWKLLKQTMK